jgi:hypothetical protein
MSFPVWRRILLMFVVVQPPVLLGFAVNDWRNGPATQSFADALVTTLFLGYLWGVPILLLLVLVHSLGIRGVAQAGKKYLVISSLLGLAIGAALGLGFAFVGLPDDGSAGGFLLWPGVSGGLYGLLIGMSYEQTKTASRVP